jgi:hypothetical protein
MYLSLRINKAVSFISVLYCHVMPLTFIFVRTQLDGGVLLQEQNTYAHNLNVI